MLRIFALCVTLFACGCEAPRDAAPQVAVKAAMPAAPYADRLRLCTRFSSPQISCPLDYLPLLGMEHSSPDVDNMLERTAVSHDWMATRLQAVLEALPDDLQQLSRPLSAVVIASDVRPSFYWSRTAAIYLDPASLWLTHAERADIDPAPDFRLAFGQSLNFRLLSRYLSNGQYAWRGFALDSPEERGLADILLPMARLLYHELAHANDFFPPATLSQLDRRLPVQDAARQQVAQQVSLALQDAFPLGSTVMTELAAVSFGGRAVSAEQLALTAEAVAAELAADVANDDYAYFTRYEDLAMLFEETMMSRHFQLQRDLAVTPVPAVTSPGAADYIVAWGQRGRLALPGVRERAMLAVERLLPDEDFTAFFGALPPTAALRNGVSWLDNLEPAARGKSQSRSFRDDFSLPDELPAR